MERLKFNKLTSSSHQIHTESQLKELLSSDKLQSYSRPRKMLNEENVKRLNLRLIWVENYKPNEMLRAPLLLHFHSFYLTFWIKKNSF